MHDKDFEEKHIKTINYQWSIIIIVIIIQDKENIT